MTNLEPVARLSRDLRAAAATLSYREARYLVDYYYRMQDDRIRDDAQIRAMTDGEQHSVLIYLSNQHGTLEAQIRGALDRFSAAQPIGEWARSHKGIGPVIASGLIAHIDIEKAHTVSQVWRFAGLDPSVRWEKGQVRPWNAELKVICWKMGESFVKVSGYEDAFYGQQYARAKASYVAANERGEYAEAAEAALKAKRWRADTDAIKHYQAGKLPPAHVHARAKRWTVKLFLSHFHREWRTLEGLPVRDPYPVEYQGHTTVIDTPRAA